MHIKNSKHEFALYLPATTKLLKQKERKLISIEDQNLYHRITKILRLTPGESFIIFDQEHHASCLLQSIQKKNILQLTIISFKPNQIIKPPITFLLPLLKKQALEDAIYSLTELGATIIQPIITAKSQHSWNKNREHERLERIIHAAAEQSKNFAFPSLKQPLSLEDSLKALEKNTTRLYFDPHGKKLRDIIQSLFNQPMRKLVLMIGPEADLTFTEKNLLKKYNFSFCALTPTILRAQQAVTVSLGIFRSFLQNYSKK